MATAGSARRRSSDRISAATTPSQPVASACAAGADAISAAARLIRCGEADAVVTDYKMPGIDGGEVARRIARTHPEIPVLLITGYAGPAEDMMDLPRLAKPFGQADIAAALAGLFAPDDKILRFPTRTTSS